MVTFIGNCSRYQTDQINILAIFIVTHIKKTHYDTAVITRAYFEIGHQGHENLKVEN